MPDTLKTQIVVGGRASRVISGPALPARHGGERDSDDDAGRTRRRSMPRQLDRVYLARLPVDGVARLPDPEVREGHDHDETSTLRAASSCGPRRSCPARSAPRPLRSRSTWRRSAPRSARPRLIYKGDRLHVLLRRQRLVEHGRCAPTRPRSTSTPGCAPRRRTRSPSWRPARRRTAARPRASPARLGGVLPITPEVRGLARRTDAFTYARSPGDDRGAEPVRRRPAGRSSPTPARWWCR